MATQLANIDQQEQRPLVVLRQQLEKRAREFSMVLPGHITPEKFQRVILTAIQQDPDLLECDRNTLMTSCFKCAADGLLPDKREAALVVYETSVRQGNEWVKIKQVQYQPMVYGLRKRILQSEEVKDIFATVVYRRELDEGYFVYEEGTERMLRHKPMFDLTDDDVADENIICAYSIATYQDGTQSFDVMRRTRINQIRQKSQTGALGQVYKYGPKKGQPRPPSGPWVTDFSEMAIKTVIRHHSKSLPMSGDILDRGDDVDHDFASQSALMALDMREPAEPARLPSRDDDVQIDATTGEIKDNRPAFIINRDEEDEETARQLDAQSGGATDDDDDDQQQDGDEDQQSIGEPLSEQQPAAEPDAREQKFLGLLKEIDEAPDKKALDKADRAFMRDRVAYTQDQIDEIEVALAAARKRITTS